MKKSIIFLFLFYLTSFAQNADLLQLGGCKTGSVLVKNMVDEITENTGLKITVAPVGNKNGMKQLINGEIDIAVTCQHPEKLAGKFEFVKPHLKSYCIFPFARDAFLLMVNKQNPIENITMEQLSKIYKGEIRNWSELGLFDKKIYPLQLKPELGSGYSLLFKEKIIGLNSEYGTNVKELPSPRFISNLIRKHKGLIAYSSFLDVPKGVKIIKLNGEYPSKENIQTKQYSSGSVIYYFICLNDPKGKAKKFIDFIHSNKGREIVNKKCIPAY
ncbi:MAG: substrate-binding domain-containing protein [Calditrichia bacterium]|nr:substrate-binding domain-containing protein [Calditrichia bacterium]